MTRGEMLTELSSRLNLRQRLAVSSMARQGDNLGVMGFDDEFWVALNKEQREAGLEIEEITLEQLQESRRSHAESCGRAQLALIMLLTRLDNGDEILGEVHRLEVGDPLHTVLRTICDAVGWCACLATTNTMIGDYDLTDAEMDRMEESLGTRVMRETKVTELVEHLAKSAEASVTS